MWMSIRSKELKLNKHGRAEISLYLGKIGGTRQIGCISAKMVLIGQIGCNCSKIGCIRANWLYLEKLVVLGQTGCVWAK